MNEIKNVSTYLVHITFFLLPWKESPLLSKEEHKYFNSIIQIITYDRYQ